MPPQSNVQKLKSARDKIAEVYLAEAIDELHDNGNLENMNKAITSIEKAISVIENRPS